MILCDPFAINTVSKSVIKQLQRLVNTELLPRVSFLSGLIITLSVRSSTTVTFLLTNLLRKSNSFTRVKSLMIYDKGKLNTVHFVWEIADFFRCQFPFAGVESGS